ncbi:MAG TPA: hypothetical protein VFU99_11470 [Gaiellaceae bacterium]|nr:hypothetical protein [Gaiellaceae bacterium]
MTRRLLVIAAGAASVVAVAHAGAVGAAERQSRVVDRTVTCTTGVHGGAHVIYLRAQSAFRRGKVLDWLAQATVSGVGQPIPSKPNYRPTLAGVTAGWPVAAPVTSGALGFSARLCTRSSRRVGLAPRGLPGGLASQLGDEFTCVVPRSLVIRIRAEFREPTPLRRKGDYYSADARIDRGQLAVTTLTGKPIAYAEVAEAGQARQYTSKRCA